VIDENGDWYRSPMEGHELFVEGPMSGSYYIPRHLVSLPFNLIVEVMDRDTFTNEMIDFLAFGVNDLPFIEEFASQNCRFIIRIYELPRRPLAFNRFTTDPELIRQWYLFEAGVDKVRVGLKLKKGERVIPRKENKIKKG